MTPADLLNQFQATLDARIDATYPDDDMRRKVASEGEWTAYQALLAEAKDYQHGN